MDEEHFWELIRKGCRSRAKDAIERTHEWNKGLIANLRRLKAGDIVEWNHIFDRLAFQAKTTDLVAAAEMINGGAGDDGFYYFRCWLIGMGQRVYEDALANADSLADVVVNPQIMCDAQAEIFGAAHKAWMDVTGKTEGDYYPARNEYSGSWAGRDHWDLDNNDEVRKRLPRLAAMYLRKQE